MYKTKTPVTALVLVLMLLALMPVCPPASAANTAVSLEQAIQTVSQNFTIPAEYSDLKSGFNSNAITQSWSLNWTNPKGKGGSFSAQVDANNGEIITMYCWKPSDQTVKIPVISVNEVRQKASGVIKRLLPSRAGALQLIPDNQLIPLNSYGSANYTVRWQRMVNGIPVEDDGATMDFDMTTGEITSYNLNWYDLKIPDAQGTISAEAAREVFVQNNMLQLSYMLPPNYVPVKVGSSSQKQPVLIYSILHQSNGVIDALNGTPLVLDNKHWLNGGMGASEKSMASDRNMNQAAPLTPEEIKEISQVANLLTQEQAAAAAKKYIDIPADMNLQSTSLDVDYQNPEVRIWNLNWASPSTATSSSTLYARVNASNGELYSFYLSKPSDSNSSTPTITEPEARQIAESFLRKVQPQRFLQVKFKNFNSPVPKGENTWQLHYQRMINSIPCPSNGMDITIDAATKAVTSFYLNWSEHTFPSAGNVMNSAQANDKFLAGAPLTLTYTTVYNSDSGPQEMRLVYKPKNPPGQTQSYIIDAVSGAWLDSSGQPAENQAQASEFKDIAGHFGEKEIRLLAQAGLFNEYGQEFRPDDKITLISMLRAMLSLKESIYGSRTMTDEQIIERAVELHWLTDAKADPATIVDRELLARLLVRYLDLEYLTKFPSLYQLPFNDASSLPDGFQPYVGLVRSTGLIIGDGVNFNASHQVTRAEAAVSLVRLLKLK
jgi:hypothetical protein